MAEKKNHNIIVNGDDVVVLFKYPDLPDNVSARIHRLVGREAYYKNRINDCSVNYYRYVLPKNYEFPDSIRMNFNVVNGKFKPVKYTYDPKYDGVNGYDGYLDEPGLSDAMHEKLSLTKVKL